MENRRETPFSLPILPTAIQCDIYGRVPQYNTTKALLVVLAATHRRDLRRLQSLDFLFL